VVEYDPDYPENPPVDNIDVEDTVGIDLGITRFSHNSERRAFAPLDEDSDRERTEKRHRSLSRTEHESRNWHKTRQLLAEAYERLNNRRTDYCEKLACWYTREYNAVFLEDLTVDSIMQQNGNSRNIASMSWYATIQAFKRHGAKNGCRVVVVPPDGTTKRCAQCGVDSEKPLWVREHSRPSCRFTTDRDHNAALEIHQLGLTDLGVEYEQAELGLGQSESTPGETGTAAGACHRDAILASAVAESGSPPREHGSPTLNERATTVASE
jgi:putative transposase